MLNLGALPWLCKWKSGELFEAFFHKAIIIDKKQGNTWETVEKVKKIGSESGSREGRFSWEKQSPWDRWRGALGESSPHYENTTEHKTPAVNGTKRTDGSHREAAACQQTPTNEWKKASEAEAAWPCFWCMKEAQTCSSASTNGHGEFPLWSVDWIDAEADHQWRLGKWREWISRGFSGRLLWNRGEKIDRCKKWKTAKKEEIMMEEVNREAGKEQRVGKQENKEKYVRKEIKQKGPTTKSTNPVVTDPAMLFVPIRSKCGSISQQVSASYPQLLFTCHVNLASSFP